MNLRSGIRAIKNQIVEFRLEAGEKGAGKPSAPPLILKDISSDKSYGVGIIGAGSQGMKQALAINKINGINLVGIADILPDRLSKTSEIAKIPEHLRFSDAEKMFRTNSEFDLVSIATTAPSHVKLGRLALNHGVKKILLEKPMDTSLRDAKEFTEECRRAGAMLAVNYSRRWTVDYKAIKRCINRNFIGQPRLVSVAAGKGELAMHGSHYFDLCSYVLDSAPSSISSKLGDLTGANSRGKEFSDPSGFCTIVYQNGTRSFIDFSEDLESKHPFILIKGSVGQITVDEKRGFWTLQSRSQKVWSFPFTEPLSSVTTFSRVICELLSGNDPAVSGADGIMSLESIFAAHLSNERNGEFVALPLDENQRLPEVLFP